MRSFFKLSSDQWNTLFSGIQAVCVVVGTLLALYGIFFTSLPERIVTQLRNDISDAKEQLIDLRKERRSIELELEALRGKLTEAQAQVGAKTRELSVLEGKSAILSAQMQKVLGERRKYFGSVNRLVVEDFMSASRNRIYALRQSALQARELVKYRSWLDEGRQAFGGNGSARIVRALGHWKEWLKKEPEIWLYSHVREEWRGLASQKESDDILKIVLERHEGYLNDFKRAITHGAEAPITGDSLVQESLAQSGLQRLTGQDQESLREQIRSVLEPEALDLAEPLSVSLPAGWTDADVVSRGEAVLRTIDRFEVLMNAMEQQLNSHD